VEFRNLKYFNYFDEHQVPPAEIAQIVNKSQEALMQSSYGVVVADHSEIDFVKRRLSKKDEYSYDKMKQ
jgi:hypothetical protein